MNPSPTNPNLSATKRLRRLQAVLCTAALAAASLFAGCHKTALATGDAEPITNHPYDPAPLPYTAEFDYRLETIVPAPDALVQWNAGYISSNNVGFEGVRHVGSALFLGTFSNPTSHAVPLFDHGFVGHVTVSHSLYNPIDFKIGLHSLPTSDAVYISGYYLSPIPNINGLSEKAKLSGMQKVPVEFIVKVPVSLKATHDKDLLVDKDKYILQLLFTPSVLNDGINVGMLDLASRTNGVVVISAVSNVGLYNTMLHNLERVLQVNIKPVVFADNK
jgi:hypothetical protein